MKKSGSSLLKTTIVSFRVRLDVGEQSVELLDCLGVDQMIGGLLKVTSQNDGVTAFTLNCLVP